jgi:predicted DNA-binding ribbon-helix-helix protein
VNKRSVTIAGHRTSVSLEPPFWDALTEIAAAEHRSVAALIASIDRDRPRDHSLSSAIRLHVLSWMRRRAGLSVSP